MTVLQNVCYGPLSTSSDKAKARELAHSKLEMLGLAGLENRLPSELSGGQQQRVAVARSLVLEPAVLLFDEPLSNLDAKLRRRVRQEIRDLQQVAVAHGDLRDPRSGGGARRLRPHHRDGQRTHRAEGHAARALRDAREPVPGRLHRRCQPRRRRAQGGRGRPDVHRGRRRDARARGRHRAGSRHARGAAEPVAPRRAGAGHACRACAGAPPTSAAGSSTWSRRRGASCWCSTNRRGNRDRATRGSAWYSIPTPRSCCSADRIGDRSRLSARPSRNRAPSPTGVVCPRLRPATPPSPTAIPPAPSRARPRRNRGPGACRRSSRCRPACRSGRGRRG